MPQICSQTLILCISAVSSEIRMINESLAEGQAPPEEYQSLQDWTKASDDLKNAYLKTSKTVLNLPLYEDLIK